MIVFADSLQCKDFFYSNAAFVFSLKKDVRMSISIKCDKDELIDLLLAVLPGLICLRY